MLRVVRELDCEFFLSNSFAQSLSLHFGLGAFGRSPGGKRQVRTVPNLEVHGR